MQKLKCIIVEDEPLAITLLAEYISQIHYLQLAGSFKNTADTAVFLEREKIDIMFLDIHLPGVKGFTFLRTITNPPIVIVTTAYHQYAVEGFELNVTDYLLKPFSFERFAIAVKKAARPLSGSVIEQPFDQTALYLTIDRKKVRIEFEKIIYIESKREYINVVTTTGNYLTKMSTHEIASLLPKNKFKRIHRSYIVALNKIESYTKRNILIHGKSISLGKGFNNEIS